jgi:acetyl esterase/lipase
VNALPFNRPPFDPEIQAALIDQRADVVTTLELEEIATLRARATVPDERALTLDGYFSRSLHVASGSGGTDVELLLLRPRDIAGPVPLIYHLHGGGLVVGTLYDDVPALAQLAAKTGCAVASVSYRLAPEHPYPAALDDAYAGLTWIVERAGGLGVDERRVIVAGVSAGGGLAAATALLARSRGGPALAGQMLICPMLDDRNDSHSSQQMAGVGAWDRTANATAWAAYLPGRAGGSDVPALAAPAREADLAGLPPAFIDVGSAETFRDEAVGYAEAIWRSGGQAELHVWPGGSHGFDFMVPGAILSRDARSARSRWLRRIVATARADREVS